jgi:hypothetical protein
MIRTYKDTGTLLRAGVMEGGAWRMMHDDAVGTDQGRGRCIPGVKTSGGWMHYQYCDDNFILDEKGRLEIAIPRYEVQQ